MRIKPESQEHRYVARLEWTVHVAGPVVVMLPPGVRVSVLLSPATRVKSDAFLTAKWPRRELS